MNQTPQKIKLGRRKKRGLRPVAALLLALCFLVVGGGIFLGVWLFGGVKPPEVDTPPAVEDGGETQPTPLPPEVSNAKRREGVYSFLVVGLDNPTNSRNTDVLMLCNFDTVNGNINIMQIPRDTYIEDPLMTGGGKGSTRVASNTCKINNLFNLAYDDHEQKNPSADGGAHFSYAMDYLCNKVSALFCVPVDFYVSFNTIMYRELLDLVCPITVEVPFDMDYDDPTQDLHIHLKKGVQKLTPEQAEGFSRFRQNNDGSGLTEGDFSRVDLQKIVLAAIAEKFLTETTLPNAHAVVGRLLENVNTSLTLDNCVWFMTRALSLYSSGTMTLDSIRMYDMPCVVLSTARWREMGYTLAYGFMENNMGYTLTIINKAFNLTDVDVTREMLGYKEQFEINYCDHSDTEGRSLQEILKKPPKVSLYG